MVLVDTSVWVDHLRRGNEELLALLNEGLVAVHPFVLGELDVNMNMALNQWAAYLNQGHDIVGIFGALHPTGLLVVPTGSPFKELKDLVGKRVGVYGLHGTSTAIFGVIAHEQLGGLDIRKAMHLSARRMAVDYA